MRVIFRGGKFDGRSRDFGPELMPVIELQVGGGKAARYVRADESEGDSVVYRLAEGDVAALPFTVHFSGGPRGGRGMHFAAEPQLTIVIPLSPDSASPDHGWFARYKRSEQPPRPGQPLLYEFVEKFEGDRS